MRDTERAPHRFDETKLLGAKSSWEFAKWDKIDAIGFIACLGVSFGILATFWMILRWASGL